MLRLYNFRGTMARRPRAPPRVLSYYPRYKPSELEDYSRVKLTLHVPFRRVEELLHLDDLRFETFTEAFEYWSATHGPAAEEDYLDELPLDPEEEDLFDDIERSQDDDIPLSWELLAAQLPNRDAAARFEDPDHLGERDLDREHNWGPYVGHLSLPDDFWRQVKLEYPTALIAESSANPDSLERQQRRFFDLVVTHYRRHLAGEGPEQMLINLDGRAGTGKSFVVMLISTTLQSIASSAGRENPILRVAPTGVAAHAINGRTLHALFRLPIKLSKEYERLTP